ncbi:MAG: GYDIA family GHMP kinase [Bacteroidota bacterium]
MSSYRANGKLLLTGEYFVLDGAPALAIPTHLGQTLDVEPAEQLTWRSFNYEFELWFEAQWKATATGFELVRTSDASVSDRITQLLASIVRQAPDRWQQLARQQLTFKLEFPQDWGLGSSSTLISLLAQHLDVNPYQLLADSFGGSGYDLACATAKQPIIYQRTDDPFQPKVTPLAWSPEFLEAVYFVHLGQKQNSREGIRYYRELGGTQATLIDDVAALTDDFIHAKDWEAAGRVAAAHEDFISSILQMERVQTQRFPDFSGVVKSLGAWGGDFVMVISELWTLPTRAYFNQRGYPLVIPYEEMILMD